MNNLTRLTALSALIATAPLTRAATKTWDGGAGTTNWSDAANWNPDGVPTSSDAVRLDNTAVNPVPQINAQSGANCGTLTFDGTVNGTALNYAGATPYVLNLYGASVNAANAGPLVNVTANAPAAFSVNKINFRLQTNGEIYIESGKTFALNNSYCSEVSGTPRTLTKTGAGTLNFSGSGPQMLFTGGFNVAAGTVITSANTLCLPVNGTVAFTNPSGTSATIQSTQSHTIAALAGGNSDSAIAVSGANGLTVNGTASTTFGGVIQDNGSSPTRLTYAGSGSLTLTNDNTYTGTTTITAGRLALGATGSLASPTLIVGAGATLDVSAVPGGFTLQAGTTLSGGSGASAGTVLGAFTVGSGATVVPGPASSGTGTLSFANGFALAVDAHLLLQLNGTAPGTGYDQILVSGGNVALAGDLDGSSLGYTPAFGDAFYLVRNTGTGTTSGTLNGVADGGKLDFGGKWFRVSLTSQQGGAGFQTGGAGKDVAIQRIDDPTPSAFTATYVGPTDQTTAQLQLSWQNNAPSATGFYIYLVQPDGSRQLVATLGASATSFSATVGSTGVYTYAIQAFNASGPLGDLNYVTTPRLGNTLADRQNQILDYLNTNTPNLSQTGSGPHRVGRTGFWFGEGRLQRGDTANGLNYIAAAVEDANAENSNAGFSLWPGMDAYFRWGSSFSTALKSRYQTIYTSASLYNAGSTPNQRFMICTASYLANTVWGSATNSVSNAGYPTIDLFGKTDNTTATDHTGKTYLQKETERAPRRGFEEDDSNHYLHFTLAPTRTLSLFAADPVLKNEARMVFDYGLALASSGWLNGRNGITSSRGGVTAQQDSYDNLPRDGWVAFGGATPGSFDDAENDTILAQPDFTGALPEIVAAATDRTQSYTRRSVAERQIGPEAIYFKQTWMTPHYALWSQVEGEAAFNPGDASFILKNLDVQAVHDGYQAQRWALAWDDPTGTDSTLTLTAPTNYGTATNSGISIYEDTLQKEDTMIAVYNIPTSDFSSGNNGVSPCHLLNGHISLSYLAITDESATTGRIFLHYNNVLVALYLSSTFSWSNNFQISPWSKGALAVETAPVSDYPQTTAAARLAAFRSDVLTNGSVNVGSITATAPRFVYKNRKGRTLDLTYGQAGIVDGDPVDYLQWPMLESPTMSQSQMGNLFIFGDNRTILYNFNDWTTTVNNRPLAPSLAGVIVNGLNPVNVNLAALANDTETPPGQLAFTVGPAVNGTVQLLSDGHTARFTAASNTAGPASFPYTVADRGIDSRLVLAYDFEPPATLSANSVADTSGNARAATAQAVGTGTASLDNTTSPPALGANGMQSLRLNESGTNAFRLTRIVTPSNLQMSNGSWTFATWFRRATRTTDDFLLYLGTGSGFGGAGDELQLYLAANTDTLRLAHYNAANAADVTLAATAAAGVNEWHHAAVVFTRTALNTGNVTLYLDGVPAGTASGVTWNLHQEVPVIFGGHALTSGATVSRYLNGWLDDLALFRGALAPGEVARLATQSVATFGGLTAGNTVGLAVQNPWSTWQTQQFGANAGNPAIAGDNADPDGDGLPNLLEYVLAGGNPTRANPGIAPQAIKSSDNRLALTFDRDPTRTDVTLTVQAADSPSGPWETAAVSLQGTAFTTPVSSSYTALETLTGSATDHLEVRDRYSIGTAAHPCRFMRLQVTRP